MWAVLLGLVLVQVGGAVHIKCRDINCTGDTAEMSLGRSGSQCPQTFRCRHGFSHGPCTSTNVQVLNYRCKTCGHMWESSNCIHEQFLHKMPTCPTHDNNNHGGRS
ncbi:hypothetical protein PGT21_009473 [Puccinia graminis f. sp. tritici]|uniref:C2H2-type domain-containing protein n=1 Tax=Puccinia graminis f. sp. tritici TaxID=56615 RepID=A0A5B0P6H8_PUCGR|nr:hypothetical protein PGT21_009473 [Puccinia graminis f. sp. tritici]KAA1099109.1 hypothetical protein PGTUg99_020145 [Puccinia graminis f. sp. tritici]